MGLWGQNNQGLLKVWDTNKNDPVPTATPGNMPGRVFANDDTGVSEQEAYETNRDNWNIANTTQGAINPYEAMNDPRGTMSDILRGQWSEFEGSTVPIIKQLEGMTTYGGNTGVVDKLKTEARQNAKAAFGNIVPDAQRQAASYGMGMNATTQGALERSSKLGMAAAEVDGVNRANQYQQDLNRQIVAGANLSTLEKK